MLWFWWCCLVVISGFIGGYSSDVTYDGRSLIIDGHRKILFSGSIHYPRSTPQMWPSLISKAKEGGLDVIQTYVFWNLHEPQPGKYDFQGRNDLVRFIKEIQAQEALKPNGMPCGIFINLGKLDPSLKQEKAQKTNGHTFLGLPFWLHDVPGIVYRSDNEPFKIVNLMKAEGLHASQGGPIILSQIENEYKNVEPAFHEKGPPYVIWAAKMAVDLQTGSPWVMCKQDDAPDPVINACNGRNCGETFAGPNSPNKPAIWTENWTSFFQVFGGKTNIRSAEDIAFAVALFLAKSGSYINYYMYHGGTNFGRTGAAYVTTSYYDQAPLDEYGLIRQPKWGHLKELHSVIKQISETLLSGTRTNFSLGSDLQDAYVFKKNSGECVAFLSNRDPKNLVKVQYQGSFYDLPPRTIVILQDCRNVIFNTSKVSAQGLTRSIGSSQKFNSAERWQQYQDVVPTYEDTSIRANMLLEHMNATKDVSDYLWYTFSFENKKSGGEPVLHVYSLGHVVHAFVNNKYIGVVHGSHDIRQGCALEYPIPLHDGQMNNVSILSAMDSGAYLEKRVAGLRDVYIQYNDKTLTRFTRHAWGYQVGLLGEKSLIYKDDGSGKVQWSSFTSSTNQPLTWYKTTFDAPTQDDDPVVLNLHSMGKGEAWINGESIGRYWVSFNNSDGVPSQILYHIPRSFLKPSGNQLALLEEMHGDPLQISLDTITLSLPKCRVCGKVSHSHSSPIILSGQTSRMLFGRRPKVQIKCPSRKTISKIVFASFGTPTGHCKKYAVGSCHSSNSKTVVKKACLGKSHCTITEWTNYFGEDPCPGISKRLRVVAECR
ncbi:hypothetical protein MKX03_009442 [Papaver bracteatum]|nr:hypothetical protein MKX03_009442 [Papaver bracteatum]